MSASYRSVAPIIVILLSVSAIADESGQKKKEPAGWPAITVARPEPESVEEAEDDDGCREPSWSDLVFNDKHRLLKVRIVLFAFKPKSFVSERLQPDWLDFESDDELLLSRIANGLKFALRPFSGISGCGAMGGEPIGQIQLLTDKGVVVIAMGPGGYGLAGEYTNSKNEFYSQSLTKEVDAICLRVNHEHIAADQRSELNGEQWLNAERRAYEQRK